MTMKWSSDKSFDGTNYTAWKVRVKALMQMKGLWDIVTGLERPPPMDSRHHASFWAREAEAKAFLLETLTDALVLSVSMHEYAHDLFAYLERTYESKNWGTVMGLRREFVQLKYKDSEDMTTHINRIKTLASKLEHQGKVVDEQERVCQLIDSLPSSWSYFKGSYYTRPDPPAWSTIESGVMAEAERRQQEKRVESPEPPTAAAVTTRNKHREQLADMAEALLARIAQQTGTTQSISGPSGQATPATQGKEKECFYCKKKGHLKTKCRLRERHLRERGIVSGPTTAATAKTTEIGDVVDSEDDGEQTIWGMIAVVGQPARRDRPETIDWIIDSGCSQHMCSDASVFEALDTTYSKQIRVATNETADVSGIGSVTLNVVLDNRKMVTVRLGKVLYVPQLHMNLLSVVQAAREGTKFDFHTKPGAAILTMGKFQVTCPSRGNRLCILRSTLSAPAALAVRAELTLDLLHRRLGHVSKDTIEKMQKQQAAEGLEFMRDKARRPCDACELGTKRRATFKPAARPRMLGCNAVVHSDITGPVEIASRSNCRYVLLFIDGYSRYCTVYLLRERSEFFARFLDYKAMAETHHNRSLQRFVSDGGGEYIDSEFLDYCRTSGIQRETTIPNTPEQNGMAESRFRILFNKVRTALIASGAPKQLWGEAIQSMTYTYNRTLASGTGVTPFERWHGHKPDIHNLRVFGSLCYVYLPKKIEAGPPSRSITAAKSRRPSKKRQKLDSRAFRGIFVGYPANQKGWLVLECESNKVIASIHVSFDESDSDAAVDLKRFEYNKLASGMATTFDFYSRTASSMADLLFYSRLPESEKPTPSDVVLLEDFVLGFDLSTVNLALAATVMNTYAPSCAPWLQSLADPQVLTSCRISPLLNATRAQQQAEALVALENVNYKNELAMAVNYGMGVEPATYKEAMLRPDAAEWRAAMDKEGGSLLENKTWTLTNLPPGKRALPTKWVYKVKYNSDGSVERYKARLVVIGYHQIKNVDYDAVFAPVVRLESLRVLLAIVCIEDLECEQMDITTAFLNGTLDEEVYIVQPEGLTTKGKEHLVCRLNKSLYGLKQAPRAWHKALTEHLRKLGFESLQCEACIYVRRNKNGGIDIVAIYVDDLVLAGRTKAAVAAIKASIAAVFVAKALGEIHYILGMLIKRDRARRKLWVSQRLNADKIVDKFNMLHAQQVSVPSVPGRKLVKPVNNPSGHIMAEMAAKPFRQAVGSLMYLMIGSRPDLAYSIQDVSRFLNAYGKPHWQAVKQIIQYVKSTADFGLEYSGERVELAAYTDSDYASDSEERKSISGYATFVGNCMVTWSSRKQRIVAQSTAEAEYIALAHCVRETLFLRQLLLELGYPQQATAIMEDNQACIAIAENPIAHSRTKHIDVRYHFVREHVKTKAIELHYVASKENIADIFTKGLAKDQFVYLRDLMKVDQCPSNTDCVETGGAGTEGLVRTQWGEANITCTNSAEFGGARIGQDMPHRDRRGKRTVTEDAYPTRS